jgi:hypothetical protein
MEMLCTEVKRGFNIKRKRKRDTDFVGKLIHASIVNHYDSDRAGNFLAAMQSKSCCLKICEVQD